MNKSYWENIRACGVNKIMVRNREEIGIRKEFEQQILPIWYEGADKEDY